MIVHKFHQFEHIKKILNWIYQQSLRSLLQEFIENSYKSFFQASNIASHLSSAA